MSEETGWSFTVVTIVVCTAVELDLKKCVLEVGWLDSGRLWVLLRLSEPGDVDVCEVCGLGLFAGCETDTLVVALEDRRLIEDVLVVSDVTKVTAELSLVLLVGILVVVGIKPGGLFVRSPFRLSASNGSNSLFTLTSINAQDGIPNDEKSKGKLPKDMSLLRQLRDHADQLGEFTFWQNAQAEIKEY